MERDLVWASLALGCIGWFSTFLLAGRNGKIGGAKAGISAWPMERALFWLAFLLPLLVWAATLPSLPPFSAGQGWGRGFLMGGIGALLGAVVIFRALANAQDNRPPSGLPLRAAATAALFAALVTVCIPLLWMRSAVIEALLGEALGWLSVSLVLFLGLKSRDESEPALSQLVGLLLTNGSAFTSALCTVAALGVYRDFVVKGVVRGTYSAVAVNLAASFALALLAGGLAAEMTPGKERRKFSASSVYSLLLGVILPFGLAYLLALKVLNDLTVIYVIGTGLCLGLLLWWLATSDRSRGDGGGERSSLVPIATLVSLCGFMLAYQLMQGFGVGLMLLAAWPVSLLALPAEPAARESGQALQNRGIDTSQLLTLFLSFLAVLLISRLFSMQYRNDLRGMGLSDQFTLFGFLAGAALPALLASLSARPGPCENNSVSPLLQVSLLRLLLSGLLALALPAAILALWGTKVMPPFFAGLGLALAGFYPAPASRLQQLSASLFALAIGVAVTQWAAKLDPLSEASRAQRLHLLMCSLGALVLLALIFDYGSRLLQAQKQRNKAGAPSRGAA